MTVGKSLSSRNGVRRANAVASYGDSFENNGTHLTARVGTQRPLPTQSSTSCLSYSHDTLISTPRFFVSMISRTSATETFVGIAPPDEDAPLLSASYSSSLRFGTSTKSPTSRCSTSPSAHSRWSRLTFVRFSGWSIEE